MANIFENAIVYATYKHSGQLRKNGEVFILHPLEVATIVATMTNDLEILSAAVLHDIIEDTDTTIYEIEKKFGKRVAGLVSHETEKKHAEMKKSDSWKTRKEESLEELKNTNDMGVKMIWLGDKLANLRSIVKDYQTSGKKAFKKFNQQDPLVHYWYYNEVLNNIGELNQYHAYKEYKELVGIFNNKNKEEMDDGKDR